MLNWIIIGIYALTIVVHVLTIKTNLKTIRIYRDGEKK